MAWYDTGTVSVTNGSTTVTGAGTNFVAGVQVGEGFSGPDGRIYEIQAVVSATALTLADPYLGSTQAGQDYKIVPTQSLVATLASQVSTLISDFQGVVDEAGEGKFSDGTAASAGITFLQDQDTGFFRPAANQIGMTTSGVQRALLTSTGLNSTVIGATTPAAGAFTTITGTADATLNGITVGKGAGSVGSNTAQGYQALLSNTSGSQNTAQGYQALKSNITGTNNTAVGVGALQANTTGGSNTAVGREALLNNTSGSGNLGMAFRTNDGTYSPVFNPTVENNRIVMGHTGVTNAYVQVAWTVVSDARDKAAFAPVPHGLDFVNSLKPTEYQFKENGRNGEADGIKRYGFLAQDVLELEGDNPVIVDTEDLDKLKLKESNLIPVLVKAIQELTAEVQTLKAKLEAK